LRRAHTGRCTTLGSNRGRRAGQVIRGRHSIVGVSRYSPGTACCSSRWVKNGVDATSVEGRRPPCPTRSETSPSTCTRRRSACGLQGGARSAERTRLRHRCSSRGRARQRRGTVSSCAARSSAHPRHQGGARARRQKAGGASRRPMGKKNEGRSRGIADARVVQYLRRPGGGRSRGERRTPSGSSASSAQSTRRRRHPEHHRHAE